MHCKCRLFRLCTLIKTVWMCLSLLLMNIKSLKKAEVLCLIAAQHAIFVLDLLAPSLKLNAN